jgi:hypothetical protein
MGKQHERRCRIPPWANKGSVYKEPQEETDNEWSPQDPLPPDEFFPDSRGRRREKGHRGRRRKDTSKQNRAEKVSRFISWIIKAGYPELRLDCRDGWIRLSDVADALTKRRGDLGDFSASELRSFLKESDSEGRYEIADGWMRKVRRAERESRASSSAAGSVASRRREGIFETREVTLACCGCGFSAGRLWKCACDNTACSACSGLCRHVICAGNSPEDCCGADVSHGDDGVFVVVCFCCGHAAGVSSGAAASRVKIAEVEDSIPSEKYDSDQDATCGTFDRFGLSPERNSPSLDQQAKRRRTALNPRLRTAPQAVSIRASSTTSKQLQPVKQESSRTAERYVRNAWNEPRRSEREE